MAKAKPMGLDRSPLHLLHRASQCAEEIFSTNLGVTNLTPRQLVVMLAVADNEGANQNRLTELTGIDRSTMADIVRRLKRRGWLQRQRTRTDARAYAIKLNDDGWQRVRQAMPLAAKVDDLILSTVSDKQRSAFIEHLSNVVSSLELSNDHQLRRPIPRARSRRPRHAA